MGIQSTKRVSREWAIRRLKEIQSLALAKNYRAVQVNSSESEEDVEEFVNTYTPLDLEYVENWTDGMITKRLDLPFFRESLFDNYLIED